MTTTDLKAFAIALVFHAALGFAVTHMGDLRRREGPRWVRVDVRKERKVEVPPPPPKPEEPPPPKPEKKVKKDPTPVPTAPVPNKTAEPPREPPKEPPPPPTFGVNLESVIEGESSVSVPVGQSTVADPKNIAKKIEDVKPLPAAPAGAKVGGEFKPASALEIKSEPEFDEGSCQLPYPEGEAKQLGVEGDTQLRVEIDEHGKVRGVRVVKGVGYGLDELAVKTMRHRCRVRSPAKNTGGQAVPYVITYVFHWVMDR